MSKCWKFLTSRGSIMRYCEGGGGGGEFVSDVLMLRGRGVKKGSSRTLAN
jgi:hypothetical protein